MAFGVAQKRGPSGNGVALANVRFIMQRNRCIPQAALGLTKADGWRRGMDVARSASQHQSPGIPRDTVYGSFHLKTTLVNQNNKVPNIHEVTGEFD